MGAGGVWEVYGRFSGGVQEVCHPHNGFFYISTIRTEKKEKKVGYRSRRITVFGDLKIISIFSFLSSVYTTQVLTISVIFGFAFAMGSAIRNQIWERESKNTQVSLYFLITIFN